MSDDTGTGATVPVGPRSILGYVLVETKAGEEPILLGKPHSREIAEELLEVWTKMQGVNPLLTWQLAEVKLISHTHRRMEVVA